MDAPNWQPTKLIEAVVFDCDGTLTSIEGIDALAEDSGSSAEVKKLTAEAMGKYGINPKIYKQRLDLVFPTQIKLFNLAQAYIHNCVPDAREVVQLLQRLNKFVYIVSAGLFPAVALFGDYLKIPRNQIYAVDIKFDNEGNLLSYDMTSPLTQNSGKCTIVSLIKEKHPEIAYVGDGLNDLCAKDLVSRFIGFGGIYYRENIAAESDFYIQTQSMTALLPLVLTENETKSLSASELSLYKKGLAVIQRKEVQGT